LILLIFFCIQLHQIIVFSETLREANEEFAARAVSHSKILAESEKQRFSMDVKLNRMKEQISKLMAQLKLEEAMRETLHRRLDMNEIDTRAAQGECARAVAQAKEVHLAGLCFQMTDFQFKFFSSGQGESEVYCVDSR
jgi:translation initiation factor 2B subunit (eIF-2B alpha/beta/delta family)